MNQIPSVTYEGEETSCFWLFDCVFDYYWRLTTNKGCVRLWNGIAGSNNVQQTCLIMAIVLQKVKEAGSHFLSLSKHHFVLTCILAPVFRACPLSCLPLCRYQHLHSLPHPKSRETIYFSSCPYQHLHHYSMMQKKTSNNCTSPC